MDKHAKDVHVWESGKAKEQQSPGSTEDPGEIPTDISGVELCVTGHKCWPRWFLLLTICLRFGADIFSWIDYCHSDCWGILEYSLVFQAVAFMKHWFCPTAWGRNLLATLLFMLYWKKFTCNRHTISLSLSNTVQNRDCLGFF